jgi:hypothetical protein
MQIVLLVAGIASIYPLKLKLVLSAGIAFLWLIGEATWVDPPSGARRV